MPAFGPEPVRQLPPDSPHGGSPFPPIAEYGFLSDCETVALVAPDGNVEWMCLPRVDSPSVFGAMLDRDAGYFRLGPLGVKVPASRRYLPGHDGARDELVDGRGLGDRPRRPADRRLAPRGGALAHPPPRADRLRRRPRAAADGPLRQRRGRDRARLRAPLRLRPRAGQVGVQGGRLPRGRRDVGVRRVRARAEDRPAAGVRGPAGDGAAPDEGGRAGLRARCTGASTRRRRTSRRPTTGSCGPPITGSTGSTAGRSPTTRGAPSCSAPR